MNTGMKIITPERQYEYKLRLKTLLVLMASIRAEDAHGTCSDTCGGLLEFAIQTSLGSERDPI
jgi:hypothetical protein